ncbi:META domain-containing protein [Roseovarius faecimaris]|uniref:META domain-containing protein n=1 Tax=Roseovarius faecimaris TaxID=2494550 RepID=A0A6I6ITI1_9RHOB|nr:META domain-containing protein [Roseovarius faecimaris]QGX99394.1 META domain-containing protein [Roseovarius faecimaris]
MIRSALAVLLTVLALAGCRADETVTAYGGADKIWHLQSLDGDAFQATATLTFPEPGQISGQAPCNSFTATQSAPYPWFTTGPVASTRRACPALKAETAFLTALSEMSLVEVLGDTMILSNDAGRQMVFKAAS